MRAIAAAWCGVSPMRCFTSTLRQRSPYSRCFIPLATRISGVSDFRDGYDTQRFNAQEPRQGPERSFAMWPFKKKTPSPGRLPIDGPWSVGEGHNAGEV